MTPPTTQADLKLDAYVALWDKGEFSYTDLDSLIRETTRAREQRDATITEVEALRAQRADLLEALEGLLVAVEGYGYMGPAERQAREALARTRGGGGA